MAYRNTIISLASVVALGTACSKAPSYNTGVQTTQTDDTNGVVAATADDPGHGPDLPPPAEDTAKETAKAETPATPPATPPANTPAAAPLTDAERAKAMNAKGYVAYAVAAEDGQGWNTAETPFLLAPSVTAAGAVDGDKPFNVVFCNFRGAPTNATRMQLHSSTDNGPTQHGNAIASKALPADMTMAKMQEKLNSYASLADLKADAENTNCAELEVASLNANPGATYNHRGGSANNVASRVFFKTMTVDPAGVVK